MLSVAVSWDLYMQTRSAVVLGNVGFVQVAPFLMFALFAGQVADRKDRRHILLFTQALYAIASVLLIFFLQSVAGIYACLFLTALASSFQWPARQAILPHIVSDEALGNAITWSTSAQEIASVSGPALAGLIIAIAGSRTIYAINIAFSGMAMLCYLSFRYRGKTEAAAAARGRTALLEGIRFVWNNKLILPALSLDLFAVLFGGATALLPIYSVDILHAGATGLGWLRAAPSVGAVLMAIALAHSPRIVSAGRVLLLAVAGFGVATIIFGLSHSLSLSFATLLLTGAFDNVSVVLRQSLVQTKTPDYVLGRVLGVSSIFISSSNQLGAVESGWTAAWFGPIISVVGGGIATIAVVIICALVSPALRNWEQ